MTAAPTLKLWQIGDELEAVRGMLYEAEGELTPEIEAALESAEGAFEEKAERVALFIRELLSNAKAVKEEAQRLSGRAATYERTAESLKHYLQAQMERAEIPKVEGKLVTVRLQKSPPSVVSTLSDDELRFVVPAAFVTIIPETAKPNAKAIIETWKSGMSLPEGLSVVQSTHVRIG